MRDNKKLVINPAESEIVERIFDLYLKGNSYQKIANILNKDNVLNKKWLDTTILKILSNPLYKGDFISGARVGNPVLYENVVEPIVSKKIWEENAKFKLERILEIIQEEMITYFFKKLCVLIVKI